MVALHVGTSRNNRRCGRGSHGLAASALLHVLGRGVPAARGPACLPGAAADGAARRADGAILLGARRAPAAALAPGADGRAGGGRALLRAVVPAPRSGRRPVQQDQPPRPRRGRRRGAARVAVVAAPQRLGPRVRLRVRDDALDALVAVDRARPRNPPPPPRRATRRRRARAPSRSRTSTPTLRRRPPPPPSARPGARGRSSPTSAAA